MLLYCKKNYISQISGRICHDGECIINMYSNVALMKIQLCMFAGPNCRQLFLPEDNADMLVLSSKLVWCFSPAACWNGDCIDLSPTNKFSAKVVARQCHTHTIKVCIFKLQLIEKVGCCDHLCISFCFSVFLILY